MTSAGRQTPQADVWTDTRPPTRRWVVAGVGGLAAGLVGTGTVRAAAPARAAARAPERASAPVKTTVEGVTRYGDLRLSDGRTARAADIHLLRPPTAFGRQVQSGLEALALGREVELQPTTTTPDRYGNIPAHILFGDGSSLQGEMLRLGLARVWPRGKPAKRGSKTSRTDLSDWFALEDTARNAGRGLWSHADHAVRAPDADALAQLMDSFQIVEGIVVATGGPRAQTYLNFGSDWRSDVTVVVPRKLEKQLPEPVRGLAGARVEARGWIEMVNGPSIWLEDARALRIFS